ncbi:hypothetical protein Hanom_Chr10g00927551 [Helianthus anomalus]
MSHHTELIEFKRPSYFTFEDGLSTDSLDSDKTEQRSSNHSTMPSDNPSSRIII